MSKYSYMATDDILVKIFTGIEDTKFMVMFKAMHKRHTKLLIDYRNSHASLIYINGLNVLLTH